MANLIPPNARRVVVREYWTRVVTVWLFLVAFVSLIVVALLVPTYVLIDGQQAALSNRIDEARSQQAAFDDATSVITEANELLAHLDRTGTTASFVELVETIDALAGTDVRIHGYTFSQTVGAVAPIAVEGEAVDRTALADFRKRLEASDAVAAVELPISNLAGERDIPFTMEITVAGK